MKRMLILSLCLLLLLGGCGSNNENKAKAAYEAVVKGISLTNSGIQRVWSQYQADSDFGTAKGQFVYGYVMQQAAERDSEKINGYFSDAEGKIKALSSQSKYYEDLKELLLAGKSLFSWYSNGNLSNTSEQRSLMDTINALTKSLDFELGDN